MGDVKEPSAPLADSPAPRRRRSRRFRLWGIALSAVLTLGVIAFLGPVLGLSRAQAAPVRPGVATQLTPTETHTPWATGTPWPTGTPHQCDGELTVKNVTNRTITVTRADGTTATIYVTSGTRYTENGRSASLTAIKAGSKLYVIGTCNHQGTTIHATSVQIVG
jgi:hypothetical protein